MQRRTRQVRGQAKHIENASIQGKRATECTEEAHRAHRTQEETGAGLR